MAPVMVICCCCCCCWELQAQPLHVQVYVNTLLVAEARVVKRRVLSRRTEMEGEVGVGTFERGFCGG